MKITYNSGSDRVIDLIHPHLLVGHQLGCVTPTFSLFAFAELRQALVALERVQLLLPPRIDELEFLGGPGDRAERNRLQTRWLANQCAKWIAAKVALRQAHGRVPQGAAVMRNAAGHAEQVVLGSFAFSTDGLGLTPGNPLSLIQGSETPAEAAQLAKWFDQQWAALRAQPDNQDALVAALQAMGEHRDPSAMYTLNVAGKVVLDGDVMTTALDVNASEAPVAESEAPAATAQPVLAAFLQAIALRHQPQANLMDVYLGWMACLLALQVARYTGTFKHEIGLQTILDKREKLQTIERLAADTTSLRSQAAKARQLAQQVDLNLALQRVQSQLTQVRSQLSNPTPQENQRIS